MRNPRIRKPNHQRPVTDFEVVFDDKGNLPSHIWQWSRPGSGGMKEKNRPFTDHMEYAGYTGSKIIMRSTKTSRTFSMFLSDFDDILQAKRLIDNQVIGTFCYCRRGTIQGLRLIFEDP